LIPEALSHVAERILKFAIPGFDQSRSRSSTYLSHHVRGACLDFLRSRDTVSRRQREARRVVHAARAQLTSELGRRPTDAETAEAAGVCESTVIECGVDLDPCAWGDWLEDRLRDTETAVSRREAIESLLLGLPHRTKSMLQKYFLESYTMREVGETYGLSESRVSQIFSNARKFLKESRASTRDSSGA